MVRQGGGYFEQGENGGVKVRMGQIRLEKSQESGQDKTWSNPEHGLKKHSHLSNKLC